MYTKRGVPVYIGYNRTSYINRPICYSAVREVCDPDLHDMRGDAD